MSAPDPLVRAVEAVLFAATEPMTVDAIRAQLEGAEVRPALRTLQADYAGRGIELVQRGERWHFQTAADMAHLLRRTHEEPRKLSRAGIETLAIVAYAFSTAVTGANGAVSLPGNNGVIALVAANLYVIFFNASWGPVMWVMLGEMFPNQIRGSGLAVSGFAQWIANAAISVSFPSLAVSPGLAVTYTGYAVFAGISFFFVQAMVKETRGRELEAMEG